MKKFLVWVILAVAALQVNSQMTQASVTGSNGTIHLLYYTPPNYRSSGATHPLIISLGGIGERGDGSATDIQNLYVGGIPKKLKDGLTNMVFTYNNTTDGFVVLAPQLPKTSFWQNFYVDEMIAYGLANFNVDPNRIFLTGYSLGGEGTWNYAFTSPNINKFAGIVPISANVYIGNPNYCGLAGNKVAVWAFQGGQDGVYGGTAADNITNTINGCSNLIVPAFDSTFPSEVHGADFWDNKVYNPTNNIIYPNVFQWMLKVSRSLNTQTNLAPVPVIAGPSVINLTAPVKADQFPFLDGSGSQDADDIIVNYLWEQTSGPLTAILPRSQWPTTSITTGNTGYPVGAYNFRLRVKDYLTSAVASANYNNTHTQFANITVNVVMPASGHAAPATDAGPNVILNPGQNPEARSGVASAIYGGSINSYNWIFVSGPQVAQLRTFNGSGPYPGGDNNVSFANTDAPGVYTFEFSAGTTLGDVGTDQFTITRLGALPVNYAFINGKNSGSKNIISWATTAEVNSDRFDILRSTDGVNFSVTGSISSRGGAILTEYTFEDDNAPAGVTYYRLSQVDKDGRTTLSKIVSVNKKRAGVVIEKYPNPVRDNLTVTVDGNTNGTLQVLIADMQGKTIMQQQWRKDQSFLKKVINVATLQKGLYQMIVTVGQEKHVSSFVKQ